MSDQFIRFCHKTNLWEECIPTDLEWMDNIEPLNEFFFWLTNCVSDRNCITPKELEAHKVLSESGKFEEESESVNENCLPEIINVYPHGRDLDVLDNLYRQNQMRLANHEDYFKTIETIEKTVDHSKLDYKIDQILENEVRKVNCLIAGEYRQSALAVAAKCSQLNENVKNISERVNFADLICLTPKETFCGLMEYLSLYISNIIEVYQTEFKKRGSISSVQGSPDDFSSSIILDPNLKRVFDDCVHLKASCVELQSQLEGITEICNALDQNDLFAVIHNCDQDDAVISEDLFTVCYEHVKAEFLKYEVKYNKDKHTKRRRILASLENLRGIARPLRLCGDSVALLIKDEYKWIRVARALLSDSLGSVEEIQHQIEQSYKHLRNIRTVHELSSATHSASDISSTLLKLFETGSDISAISHNDTVSSVCSTWLSDCRDMKSVENAMSRTYTGRLDSAFKMMKSFSEDIKNLLSHARMVYCHIFNGPSATMSLDSDLIASIIRISRELRSKKDELEKLDSRRIEIELHRRNNERHNLMEKSWLLYLQNPQQLRQIVEAIEARTQLTRINHLALNASDSDCLEEFLQ